MAEGWKCPVCSRGVRPDKDTCDHGGMGFGPAVTMPGRLDSPGTSYPPPSTTWPYTTWVSVGTVSDPNLILRN